MEAMIDRVREFIIQEIELYGDDYIVSNDLIQNKPVQSASGLNRYIFCEGNSHADLAVVLETSQAAQTIPQSFFAGEHSALLTKILGSIGFNRDNVFFYVLARQENKQNFDDADFSKTLSALLFEQLNLAQPAFILCFGKLAGQILSHSQDDVDKLRGKKLTYANAGVIVTHHPETLAKNEKLKRETWDDMKLLQQLYNNWKQEKKA